MKTAIESLGGVPGMRVMLCDTQTIPKLVSLKSDGVSFINNIEHSNEGMRVWRSYAVGPGKFLPWSKFNFPENYSVLYETFFIQELRPALNVQSDSIRAKVFD